MASLIVIATVQAAWALFMKRKTNKKLVSHFIRPALSSLFANHSRRLFLQRVFDQVSRAVGFKPFTGTFENHLSQIFWEWTEHDDDFSFYKLWQAPREVASDLSTAIKLQDLKIFKSFIADLILSKRSWDLQKKKLSLAWVTMLRKTSLIVDEFLRASNGPLSRIKLHSRSLQFSEGLKYFADSNTSCK